MIFNRNTRLDRRTLVNIAIVPSTIGARRRRLDALEDSEADDTAALASEEMLGQP